jgi:peptidyl-prolyl cis-trans isomerase B (cyclophilin B)
MRTAPATASRAPRAALRSCALLAGALLGACGGSEAPPAPKSPESFVSAGPHERVVLALEGLGEIHIELLPELAPQTVAHFKKLVSEGFFDGTTFHRVIPGFMLQGGDPLTRNRDPRDDGDGGPGYTIADEFSDYPHVRGTVAMAHRGHRATAGSQFFIIHQDSHHLDGSYTVFGRVVAGMEVVDAVTQLEIDKYGRYGPRDRPYPVDARIASARIEAAGAQGRASAVADSRS